MEKRGRSPSLRQKNWNIEQQSRSSPELIYYSVVEQKKLLSSAELKKVPIYSKYTVSSLLYAQNVKRPHKQSPRRSIDKPHPPIALSKVLPTKTKSNEDNLSSSYTKPSSPKPEDTIKKPHPRNYVNVTESNVIKSRQKQPTKGFGSKTVAAEKKLRFHDDDLLSSKDLTTYGECDKIITSNESTNDILIVEVHNNQHLVEDLHGEMESQEDDKIIQCTEVLVPICLEGNADDDKQQSNTCSDPDNVMVVKSVNNEHLNDHNDETNQQDQACEETFDVVGDHHLTRFNVDKENQLNEQVTQEEVGIRSKVVEDDEERKQKELEVKEGGDDDDVAPDKEDLISKMVVAYQQVVAHGKKDIATYNSVTEETISKLRERRSNKVKALVGAFESVISHDQYDVLPKRLLHINKIQTC